jgi:hypothetical protein
MRSPFHTLALLVCLALWGCGGSGGGSSSNSSSGGGGDSTIPISAATYADRLVLVTSSSDISLYGLSDGGGAENLSATEVSASWSVASNLITINESRPDINGDGMLDSYRFTGAAVGSVNTLNGQHLINISPSESYTPAARAFRLPTVNSVGALSTALTWEADDGFRYTFSTNSGEGTITATTRPGFMSGTVLVTGGWIYLRATYFDSGMTKRVHLIAVRDTTDGTVLHGVQAIDNSGLTPTVDESATLVAVPGGAG